MAIYTYGKKEIKIERAPIGAHFTISFAEGGQLPKEMKGMFTSHTEAERAIKAFIQRMENLEPKSTRGNTRATKSSR
jgi:hypothetical protein